MLPESHIGSEMADQSATSSFSDRRRRRKQELRQSSNHSNPIVATGSLKANTAPRHSLLELFQVVAYHHVRILSIEPTQQWNVRQALGQGASFAVEQTGLPISSTLSHLRYRDLDIKGPDKAFYFTDHTRTRWAHNQVVAFKSVRDKSNGLSDLIKELRVYCHPPIQQHPHIVRLLGIALVMEQDPELSEDAVQDESEILINWELQEIPLLVIEKAPHASLSKFLKSDEFNKIPSSLKAKLRLCTDVLSAVEALHSCQIIHGDVKCDNVLVFKTETSTGENWRAKITDFGHCELDVDDGSPAEEERTYFGGTKYYAPPELVCSSKDVSSKLLKSVDIWCWGMLLWEVIVNGTGFDYSQDDWLDDMQMQHLKEEDLISTSAKSRCINFLNENHHHEVYLFSSVTDALGYSLYPDPSERQSATIVLEGLKHAIEDYSGFVLKPSRSISMPSLPFFDITRLYYDLNGTVTIPARIYKELKSAKDIAEGEELLNATYQMGLCCIVGFGTEKDFKLAVDLVMEAANGGHQEAQAIILQLSNALGIDLPPDVRKGVDIHLSKAVERRSRIAMHHLKVSNNDRYDFPVEPLGFYGDTPLHWATLLPAERSASTVRYLLDSGCSIWPRTSHICPTSNNKTTVDIMPSNTTAIDWAIIANNLAALTLIKEEIDRNNNNDRLSLYGIKPIMAQLSYAAYYQSIECLKYLCVVNRDELDSFDTRGFSTIYYAVRPNIFDRIFRYQPSGENLSTGQHLAPFMARQIQVIQILLESGCNLGVRHENLFNCLHITAAVGEQEILEWLLQTPFRETLINETSAFGWTPLKDAIMRGNTATVDLLLKHGADPETLWPAQTCHALHVCCLFQGGHSVEIATNLLRDYPTALRHRDSRKSTPLHKASQHGHTKLIELFLSAGASLLDINADRLTPLGLAIRFRFVLAVALLSSKCRKQKLPFLASNGFWTIKCPMLTLMGFVPLPGRYISALDYLLAPGIHSPHPEIKHDHVPLQREWSLIGTYDEPFSKSSLKILEILVNNYEHQSRFGVNLCLSLSHATYRYDSGLHWAVRMGNFDAINCILLARSRTLAPFKPELRDLIELAYKQRLLGRSHVGTEEAREKVISHLREEQRMEHRSRVDKRTRRNKLRLVGRLWTIYYRVYGGIEQEEYDRANTWLLEARPTVDPRFLEFRQWYYPRYSLYPLLFFSLWLILIPTLTCYTIVACDPSSGISTANIAYTLLMVIVVNNLVLWPKLFRIVSVFYDWACEEFPGDGWIMGWIQCALCLLFIGLAVFDLWVINPDNTKLVRFKPWPGVYFLDGWNGLDLPSRRRNILFHFHDLCRLLMAWTVFVQIIPPILVAWTRIVRRAEMFGHWSPRVNPNAPIGPQSKKSYVFGSRVFWFLPGVPVPLPY